jgi:hypothetical protein
VESSEPRSRQGPEAFGPDEAEPETGAATSSPHPNASDPPSAEPAAPVADPLAWENVMRGARMSSGRS